jgi:hypothetical protein
MFLMPPVLQQERIEDEQMQAGAFLFRQVVEGPQILGTQIFAVNKQQQGRFPPKMKKALRS